MLLRSLAETHAALAAAPAASRVSPWEVGPAVIPFHRGLASGCLLWGRAPAALLSPIR